MAKSKTPSDCEHLIQCTFAAVGSMHFDGNIQNPNYHILSGCIDVTVYVTHLKNPVTFRVQGIDIIHIGYNFDGAYMTIFILTNVKCANQIMNQFHGNNPRARGSRYYHGIDGTVKDINHMYSLING